MEMVFSAMVFFAVFLGLSVWACFLCRSALLGQLKRERQERMRQMELAADFC